MKKKIDEILKNQPSYRKKQIQQAIYQQLINDWDEAKNLPKNLREQLKQEYPLIIPAKIINSGRITKAIITLEDKLQIESVLINNRDGRYTVCVSSQVGCPMACVFCATGNLGFKRNLTTLEIINQILLFSRELKKNNKKINNVVFMGMGEPLLNLSNVLMAIKIINNPFSLGIGARFISISTCGIPEGIKKLIKFPLQINLAISLHAPNNNLRKELMPIASQYTIEEIWRELKNYLTIKKRKVMIEYVMINKVNDSELYAEELIDLLLKLPRNLIMVNLIPYNQTGKYYPTNKKQMEKFKMILQNSGIKVVIRESLGGEIFGACGQLANQQINNF